MIRRAKYWLNEKTHVSMFLAVASVGIMLGAVLGYVLNTRTLGVTWLVAAFCMFVIAVRKSRRRWLVLAILCGLIIGMWRSTGYVNSVRLYEEFIGQDVTVQGVVADDPALNTDGKYTILVRSVYIDGVSMPGTIRAVVSGSAELKRSDTITVVGTARPGFGSNVVTIDRAIVVDVTREQYGDIARQLRDSFASVVRKYIDEPEVSLGLGFLVGQRGSLPQSFEDELRAVGLTHIVVASGYNLTILVRLSRRKMMRVSRYSSLVTALALVGGFVMVTGFSPSMTRAAIVVVMSLFSWYYGRKIPPLVLIFVAAAITVLIKPTYIWGDIGWYLSFLSFFGVLIIAPLLKHYFFADKTKDNTLRDILIETSSAQLMTIPLIVYVFGEYSPLSLIANILVLPVIPLVMLLMFSGGVVSAVVPFIGNIVNAPAEILLSYIVWIVGWISRSPYAKGAVEPGNSYVLVLYIVILAGALWMYRKTRATKPFDISEMY